MIAVTAASGRLGRAVLSHLAGRVPAGALLAISRSECGSLPVGVRQRRGDYGSVDSMAAAFEGVERVLFVSAPVVPGIDRVALHRNVIGGARRAGVGWVTYTSVIGNGAELDTWFGPTQQVNRQTEEDLRGSGLGWSIARNALYLDLDLAHIRRAAESEGVYANPAGDGRCAYLGIDEIAGACAELLLQPRHRGHCYNVTGDSWTQAEIVAMACEIFGWNVRYETISDEAYLERFLSRMPERGEAVARMLTGAFQCIRSGAYDVPSDYAVLTGRPAKSLRTMLTELRDAMSSRPPRR